MIPLCFTLFSRKEPRSVRKVHRCNVTVAPGKVYTARMPSTHSLRNEFAAFTLLPRTKRQLSENASIRVLVSAQALCKDYGIFYQMIFVLSRDFSKKIYLPGLLRGYRGEEAPVWADGTMGGGGQKAERGKFTVCLQFQGAIFSQFP